MKYNARSLWVSRIVDWGQGYVGRPSVAAFLTMGWIPIACSVVALDASEASTAFLVGQALACLMVVPAPFDVWYYDERLLPQFFDDIRLITAESDYDTLERLATRFDTYYVRYWWASVLVWVGLVLTVFVVGENYFQAQGITTTVELGAYLGFFCYWLLFAGLRSHGGLITVFVIYAFAEEVTLDAHRDRIRKLEDRLALRAREDGTTLPDDDLAETNDELLELEIRRARREFDDYQNVQLYPLSIGIITRLVSSLLLPVLFILFELFITGSL